MEQREKELEYQYLDTVRALLKKRAAQLERKVSGHESDIEESGYKMWDELTHVIRDFDDVAALTLYDADIARQDDDYRNTLMELRNMLSLYRIPYFGRLDFVSDRDGFREKVYVGAHSFFDRETFEPYVYDWRTPIASMFYDCSVGPASFKSPDGVEKGQVVLKRRFKIRDGKMQLLYDTDDSIHDDVLGEALSENTQARLKVIIESIQQEQNRAIRDDTAGDFIIFGAAGSGKTSVGLHRFAYLLYKNRERLNARNFEIISRNGVFRSYIADILPELGEEDARCTVFDDIINRILPPDYRFEEYYPQAEYVLTAPPEDIRLRSITAKGSSAFRQFVQDWFDGFELRMPEIVCGDTVLCTAADFTRRCRDMRKTRPFDVVLAHAQEYASTLLEDYYDLHKKEILNWIWHSDAELFEDEYEEEYIRQRRDSVQSVVNSIREINDLDILPLYLHIFSAYCDTLPDGEALIAFTRATLDEKQLYYEDAVCLSYLAAFLGQFEPDLLVRQLLIDEAQDFSAFQHALLKRVYPHAVFTILADPRQSVFPGLGLKTEGELTDLYPGCHSMSLQRSNRSTGPICALASALTDSAVIDFFDRSGEKPQVLTGASREDMLRIILKSGELTGYQTVGIICSTAEQATILYQSSGVPAQLLTDPEKELKPGVVILPAALSKGLEFDAVIADCSALRSGSMLYLLCTRALHRLYLLCPETLPEPLARTTDLWEARNCGNAKENE